MRVRETAARLRQHDSDYAVSSRMITDVTYVKTAAVEHFSANPELTKYSFDRLSGAITGLSQWRLNKPLGVNAVQRHRLPTEA